MTQPHPHYRPNQAAPRPNPAAARTKGRRTRRIVIVLVVLAIVLVGADFGAAAMAEHAVSQKAREQLKLADDPSVTIHGFPFATQAIGGDYSHIELSAAGVPVKNTLRDVELNADLWDVTAPLSDLMNGNTNAIKIGRLDGEVKIKASDIAKIDPLTKIENFKIEPSTEEYVKTGQDTQSEKKTDKTGTNNKDEDSSAAAVRLSGEVEILGKQTEIFAFAMLELDGKAIRISPTRLQFGNDKQTTVVPPEVQRTLLPNFEARIDFGELPFTVTPTAVRVEKDAVIIKGEAKDVTFAGVNGAG